MEPALLARIQDELGLGEALLAEPAALLAAARRSLRLEPAEASDASVREVCEELGLDPAQPSPSPAAAAPAAPPPDAPPADVVAAPAADSAAAEEGVPPPGRGRPAPSLLAPPPAIAGPPAGAGGVPPAYAEALDLLEDPRRVYAVARATPGPKPPPEWRDQLLAQLALRNEFQGGTLRGLIELVRHTATSGPSPRRPPPRSSSHRHYKPDTPARAGSSTRWSSTSKPSATAPRAPRKRTRCVPSVTAVSWHASRSLTASSL